ncbi:MAG: Rrf2 family transcriptional regulator [Ferruginibacter sp.]
MLLSQTSKAAIKAVACIAGIQHINGNVHIKQIVAETGENEHTIAKLLQVLVKQDVVSSSRGIGGGFFITKTQLKQPIVNIVVAIEGSQAMSGCVLGLSRCSSSHPCPVHFEFAEVRARIEKLFSRTKISDITETVASGLGFLKN